MSPRARRAARMAVTWVVRLADCRHERVLIGFLRGPHPHPFQRRVHLRSPEAHRPADLEIGDQSSSIPPCCIFWAAVPATVHFGNIIPTPGPNPFPLPTGGYQPAAVGSGQPSRRRPAQRRRQPPALMPDGQAVEGFPVGAPFRVVLVHEGLEAGVVGGFEQGEEVGFAKDRSLDGHRADAILHGEQRALQAGLRQRPPRSLKARVASAIERRASGWISQSPGSRSGFTPRRRCQRRGHEKIRPNEAANPIRQIERVFRESAQGLRAPAQHQAARDQRQRRHRRGGFRNSRNNKGAGTTSIAGNV